MTAYSNHLDQPLLDPDGLDLERASCVTYVLQQRFRYDYDGPVRNLEHRLVVIPRSRHGSLRRRGHVLDVSSPRAQIRAHRDSHGNPVLQIRLDVVPPSVEFTIGAVVERVGPTADATLPISALTDPRLLRPTRLTAVDAGLRELAATLRSDASDPIEFAERCSARVRAAIDYQPGATSVTTTAVEAFAGGRGVCQDHAHVMLALCRAAGVPARYVSGHLLGQGGTHAWVEVVVPDGARARAIGFDPCNGCRAGARHLPVAVGRDYRDVAPTSGHFVGDARGRLTSSRRVGVTAAA